MLILGPGVELGEQGGHTVVENPHTMIKCLHRQLLLRILQHSGHKRRVRDGYIIYPELSSLLRIDAATEESRGGAREGGKAVEFDVFAAGHFGGGRVVMGEWVGDDGAGWLWLWLWHDGCGELYSDFYLCSCWDGRGGEGRDRMRN